jgi:hypothetical protein
MAFIYSPPLRYGVGRGRRNKVLRLTPAKVKYITRAKINNVSSRIISMEMKVSVRTVNRVWGHWMKNKELIVTIEIWTPQDRSE